MRRADRRPLFARRQRRKESVLVAVKIYPAAPGNMEARLHRLLWIELLEADAVHSRICHKANVVILGHGMIERDVPIVLDALDGKGVVRVRLFGLLGKHRGATAAKAAFSERVHNVSADRANVKDAFEHIACTVGVGPNITSQKLSHAYAESLGQRLNEGNVGKAAAGGSAYSLSTFFILTRSIASLPVRCSIVISMIAMFLIEESISLGIPSL